MNSKIKEVLIPKEILNSSDLSLNEKVLLSIIIELSDKDNQCVASNKQLSKILNISKTSVSTGISKLINLGYLKPISFNGRQRILEYASAIKKKKSSNSNNYIYIKQPTINLENKDCLDFLKDIQDNSVDLVLIDPPYEVSRDTNFQSGEKTGRDTDRFRVSMNFGEWDNDFHCLAETIKECYRVLKKSGTIICFYDLWKITTLKEYLESANFKQLRFIEWIKTNPVPLNSKTNYLTNSREIALVAVKGEEHIFNSDYDSGIYRYPICHDEDRFHPTQKPVELFEDLIIKHSNEGDTVLDCFSGSGTTAIASYNTNRNFIGCEISKEYYDNTIKRFKLFKIS